MQSLMSNSKFCYPCSEGFNPVDLINIVDQKNNFSENKNDNKSSSNKKVLDVDPENAILRDFLQKSLAQRDSLKNLTLAATHGHIVSAKKLANFYLQGEANLGIAKNINLAVKYLTVAADGGDRDAAYEIGKIYFDGKEGIAQNLNEAIKNLKNAALWGKPEAITDAYLIGNKYNNGDEKEEKLAVLFYEIAVEAGHGEAAGELGTIFVKWKGEHSERAIYCLELAISKIEISRNKCTYASVLGSLFLSGIGTEIDLIKAAKYLKLSIDWGSAEAMQVLIGLYKKQNNLVEANYWEEEFKKTYRNLYSATIEDLGGRYLTTATNNPYVEFSFIISKGNVSPEFWNVFEDTVSQLKKVDPLIQIENDFSYPDRGACAALIIEFNFHLSKLTSNDDFETKLLTVAKNYECSPGVTAVARQVIYDNLFNQIRNGTVKRVRTYSIKPEYSIIEFTMIDQSEVNSSAAKYLFNAFGQTIVKFPNLGLPGSRTDEEYLKEWYETADGNYEISVKVTEDSTHSMGIFKNGDQTYIWDPNFGLIKCSLNNPVETILKYLSTFYPEVKNHHLDISRIEPLEANQ